MTSLQNLIEGFHRFREQHFTDDDTLYRQLVQDGQTPKILVVACCDSRVDPALEFGVRNLNVEHIIVLGHAHCGGIRALMSGRRTNNDDSFINSWMRLAGDARTRTEQELANDVPEIQARACERHAILGSLDNLMTFPWIRERVEQGTLALHGWYFDIECGELLGYNPASRKFEVL